MATKSKKVAKKAVAKKSTPVKKVAKKAAPKKAVKKAAPAKKIAKKAMPEKEALKKAVTKKTAPKKPVATKKVTTPVIKKATPKAKVSAKAKPVSAASTAPMAELSEELVEKAANTGDNKPMLEQTQTAPQPEQDPVQAFDKHAFNKATTKVDPHSKLHLSSKPKNAIKPSGKKLLWR